MCCAQICSRAAINNSLSRAAQHCPRSSFILCPDRELLTLSTDILIAGFCGRQPQGIGWVGLPSQGSRAEATTPLPEQLWSSQYLLLPSWAPLSSWIPPDGSPLLCLGLSCRDWWSSPASAFVLGTSCELHAQQAGPSWLCHVLGKCWLVLRDQTQVRGARPSWSREWLESHPASCLQSPCSSPLWFW